MRRRIRSMTKSMMRGIAVAACLLAAGQAAGYPAPSMDRSMIPADMPADVRRLVEQLYDENDGRCSSAAQALAEMGPAAVSAAPFLASVLHGHYSLRTPNTAAKALVRIGPGAFDAAAAASSSGDDDAQRRAFHAITLVDPERSAPVVFDAMGAGEVSIRNLAFLRRGGNAARVLVLEALRSDDATLRVRAVRALPAFTSLPVSYRDISGIPNNIAVSGRFDTQETVDLLLKTVADADAAVRAGALESLALLASCSDKKLRMGEPIRMALGDPAVAVRLAAIEVAVRLDETAAARIEALAPLASDPDPAVRAKLAERVMRLPGHHGPVPTFSGEETRLRSLLLGLLGDTSEEVREEAVRGLGDVRAFQVVETIAKMLDDPRRETAVAAAGALGRIGGVASADALLAKARSGPEPLLRLEIVKSLGAIYARHFANRQTPSGKETPAADALDPARVDAISDVLVVAMQESISDFHLPAIRALLCAPVNAGKDLVPSMTLALSSPDTGAREAAQQAILRGTVRDERLLDVVRDSVRKGNERCTNGFGYQILGRTNDPRNIAVLEVAVKRGGLGDANFAISALIDMGEAGLRALLRLLPTSGSGIASEQGGKAVVEALRNPKTREFVQSLLAGKDDRVRQGARWALDLADGKAASPAGPPRTAPPQSPDAPDASTNKTAKAAATPPASGLQLVDISGTYQDRFLEIGGWIRSKQYGPAVEALHALLAPGTETGFYPLEGDRSRYVAVGSAATRLLAALPDDALELYSKRRDVAARDRFDAAAKTDEEGAYEAVGERYFHTRYGARAAQRSAALALDRGYPLRAAATWEMLGFLHRGTPAERAAWIGKACTAYHMAGARDKAAAMLETIRKDHASAEVSVAGSIVRWQAFLDDLVKAAPASPPAGTAGTKALAGAAPVLLWTGNNALRRSFVGELPGLGDSQGAGENPGPSVTFESGRVRVARPPIEFDLPSLVHPVAVEGMALCRRESAIVATALDSGAELWRTRDLPLHRPRTEFGYGSRNRWIVMAGDMGRYTLCLGDGAVYALSRLSALGDGAGAVAAGGSLTALAVGRDAARTIWEIGNGKGDHPSTREAKCLTVPTVHAGRLYALARLGNRYVALCLDAATGNLVWDRPLGVVPMRGGSEFSSLQACAVEMVTERGSPPAVAGGIAVFLTNSGVLAGLDAATGAPVWAHRYDSRVSGAAAGQATVTAQGQALLLTSLRRPYFAANPVILDQDRVICLPCDSDFVLALHARTGELLWRRERGGQEELTATGDSRLLLTGPDMAVLRAEDGAVLFRREAAILGRPAVAGGQVFASGKGSVLHVDLAGFAVSETPVGDGRAVLGNLTATPAGLIAAHAGGLSAWVTPQ